MTKSAARSVLMLMVLLGTAHASARACIIFCSSPSCSRYDFTSCVGCCEHSSSCTIYYDSTSEGDLQNCLSDEPNELQAQINTCITECDTTWYLDPAAPTNPPQTSEENYLGLTVKQSTMVPTTTFVDLAPLPQHPAATPAEHATAGTKSIVAKARYPVCPTGFGTSQWVCAGSSWVSTQSECYDCVHGYLVGYMSTCNDGCDTAENLAVCQDAAIEWAAGADNECDLWLQYTW